MKPLPLRPWPVPSEPLLDYLERLANANGYSALTLWDILNCGEYPHEKILAGALNGHPLPAFSGPAHPRVKIPVDVFGLQADDFMHYHRRWCPLCVENAAWIRPFWRLKLATVCDTHRIRLLQSCPGCGVAPTMQTIMCGTCECGIHFSQAVVPATSEEVLLAQVFTTSLTGGAALKLQGKTVVLDAPQFVRMIFYTGRLSDGPQLSRPGQIRDLDQLGVASQIFNGTATLLTDWPNEFWKCLERFAAALPNDTSVLRVFDSLYHVIYKYLREPVYQFWRDAFELYLHDHWRGDICDRYRLFRKETIEGHHYQGLARVARITGIGAGTLKRMAQQNCLPANCVTRPSKREFVTIDTTQLDKYIPRPDEYLDLRGAANVLGLRPARLRKLVTTEFILTDMKPDWSRSHRWHFRRSEVRDFMEVIRQSAVVNVHRTPTVTLNYALQYWRITAVELNALLRAMKRGDIPFYLAVEGRLRDVKFGKTRLRDWLEMYRKSANDWVFVTAAASLLHLKEQVVYQLVAKNLLLAEAPKKKGDSYRRISLASLARFQKQYVSLAELAKRQKTSPKALLSRIYTQPVTGPNVDGGIQYFYRRADLSSEYNFPPTRKAQLYGHFWVSQPWN